MLEKKRVKTEDTRKDTPPSHSRDSVNVRTYVFVSLLYVVPYRYVVAMWTYCTSTCLVNRFDPRCLLTIQHMKPDSSVNFSEVTLTPTPTKHDAEIFFSNHPSGIRQYGFQFSYWPSIRTNSSPFENHSVAFRSCN